MPGEAAPWRRSVTAGSVPERDSDLETTVRLPEVGGPVVVDVPVHPGGALVVDLQAVHAHVAAPLAVLGDHDRQRDEGAPVTRPRGEHR